MLVRVGLFGFILALGGAYTQDLPSFSLKFISDPFNQGIRVVIPTYEQNSFLVILSSGRLLRAVDDGKKIGLTQFGFSKLLESQSFVKQICTFDGGYALLPERPPLYWTKTFEGEAEQIPISWERYATGEVACAPDTLVAEVRESGWFRKVNKLGATWEKVEFPESSEGYAEKLLASNQSGFLFYGEYGFAMTKNLEKWQFVKYPPRLSVDEAARLDPKSIAWSSNALVIALGGELWSYRISGDNSVWQKTESGWESISLVSARDNPEQFVAIASPNIVLVSSDGYKWRPVKVDSSNRLGVAFSKSSILVYDESAIFRIQQERPELIYGLWGLSNLVSTAFGGNTFVVTTQADGIFTSSDGMIWRTISVPLERGEGFGPSRVKFVSGKFFTFGSYSNYWVSTDGLKWQKFSLNTREGLQEIVFLNGQYLLYGSWGSVWKSKDGIKWSPALLGARPGLFGSPIERVVYGNNTFVAVGEMGLNISKDGVKWAQIQVPGNPRFRSIAFGNGVFVVVGDQGIAFFSKDGRNWRKAASLTSEDFLDVSFADGVFVAVGRQGVVRVSRNGETWRPIQITCVGCSVGDLFSVSYGKGSWVIAGRVNSIGIGIWHSQGVK